MVGNGVRDLAAEPLHGGVIEIERRARAGHGEGWEGNRMILAALSTLSSAQPSDQSRRGYDPAAPERHRARRVGHRPGRSNDLVAGNLSHSARRAGPAGDAEPLSADTA